MTNDQWPIHDAFDKHLCVSHAMWQMLELENNDQRLNDLNGWMQWTLWQCPLPSWSASAEATTFDNDLTLIWLHTTHVIPSHPKMTFGERIILMCQSVWTQLWLTSSNPMTCILWQWTADLVCQERPESDWLHFDPEWHRYPCAYNRCKQNTIDHNNWLSEAYSNCQLWPLITCPDDLLHTLQCQSEGPIANFSFASGDQWNEATWLTDCWLLTYWVHVADLHDTTWQTFDCLTKTVPCTSIAHRLSLFDPHQCQLELPLALTIARPFCPIGLLP